MLQIALTDCRRSTHHAHFTLFFLSFGFKITKEVTEKDVQDRLVWGAIGTLMELDLESFFERWTPRMPLLIEQAKRAREAEAEAKQTAGDEKTEDPPK
jgi:hypothetical protein